MCVCVCACAFTYISTNKSNYDYLAIFLKVIIFLVFLEICSLIILPIAFSSSVVPDYQAKKTLIRPTSLQGPVSGQLNTS